MNPLMVQPMPAVKVHSDVFDTAMKRLAECAETEPQMVRQFLARTETRQLFQVSSPPDKYGAEIIMIFVSPSKRLLDFIERMAEAIREKAKNGE